MKKILVTGGTGFIGSHTVVELVAAGYTPILIDNFANSQASVLEGLERILGFRPTFYQGDCNDAAILKRIFGEHPELSGIIHFAADKAVGESVQQPLKYYRNNIGSLLTLLELMPEAGIKNLVFSSSCTVYGQPDVLPVTEAAPFQPAQSPYGNTKQVCEEILRDSATAAWPVRSLALRYFNPIGAHPSAEIGELPNGVPQNLVPFITQTAMGKRAKLSVFGNDYDTADGSCVRDYIHVVDLAQAHVKALAVLEAQSSQAWYDFVNVGTGVGSTVLQVVEAFQRVSGVALNYEIVGRRPGDVEKIWAKADKSEQVLGWKPRMSLDQALADAWRWEQKLAGQ